MSGDWRKRNLERARASEQLLRDAKGSWRQRNVERARAAEQRHREINRERVNAKSREQARRDRARNPEKFRAYIKQRRLARKAEIDVIKLTQGCVDCGYREHAVALDFDHRDPATKRFTIAANLHRAWSELIEEMAKCEVRCANCHRVRTASQDHSAWRTSARLQVVDPQLSLFEEAS